MRRWIGRCGGATDESGVFAAPVPQPGRYRFSAFLDGFAEAPFREVEIGPDGRTDLIAELTRGSEITGTVVDTTGRPVPGARIRTTDIGHRPVVANARGRFAITNPFHSTVLIAHHGDQASTWMPVEIAAGQRAEVELRLGPAGVTGTVVDRNRVPVAHAEVFLNYCCEDGLILVPSATTHTDDQGRFALDTPRGELKLSLRRDADDDFDDADDVLVSGGARDLRLVLP